MTEFMPSTSASLYISVFYCHEQLNIEAQKNIYIYLWTGIEFYNIICVS